MCLAWVLTVCSDTVRASATRGAAQALDKQEHHFPLAIRQPFLARNLIAAETQMLDGIVGLQMFPNAQGASIEGTGGHEPEPSTRGRNTPKP